MLNFSMRFIFFDQTCSCQGHLSKSLWWICQTRPSSLPTAMRSRSPYGQLYIPTTRRSSPKGRLTTKRHTSQVAVFEWETMPDVSDRPLSNLRARTSHIGIATNTSNILESTGIRFKPIGSKEERSKTTREVTLQPTVR